MDSFLKNGKFLASLRPAN